MVHPALSVPDPYRLRKSTTYRHEVKEKETHPVCVLSQAREVVSERGPNAGRAGTSRCPYCTAAREGAMVSRHLSLACPGPYRGEEVTGIAAVCIPFCPLHGFCIKDGVANYQRTQAGYGIPPWIGIVAQN